MPETRPRRLGVLTSGGDAPGMNAAIRAVVRSAIDRGLEVFAITEGFQGMVEGGDRIQPLTWESVGGILYRGGTVIGTARSDDFRTRDGRRRATANLVRAGIDAIVVIGGDGSLTGADVLRSEWSALLAELVDSGTIEADQADRHAELAIVGLVGSIDNDMAGTDMTIGADTALHRITEAVDAITSTAASHQRTFVIEVMGRHCGYLALMGALATGADWVFLPEYPPAADEWPERLCDALRTGRAQGRRESIVVMAEGAIDRDGTRITSEQVRAVLQQELGEDTRVTILGHVQRGGSPSAFDRWMSSLLGTTAVEALADTDSVRVPELVGVDANRIVRRPLMDCVARTREISDAVRAGDGRTAMALRGEGFGEAFSIFRSLVRPTPPSRPGDHRPLRLAIVHSGGPAPGMNTAARAAVRLGLDHGHEMIGVRNGFHGLVDGDLVTLDWRSVDEWAGLGGVELGTNRFVPSGSDLYAVARTIEDRHLDGLLMVGGWSGYEAVLALWSSRGTFPSFNIPLVCLPASIDNNLPGSELSVGADTALNSIVMVVDRIKQSAVASCRCFVVEVMGKRCGYLAMMSGIASGAERVYLAEEGVHLADLVHDLEELKAGFAAGKRVGLLIRNEGVSDTYTTAFITAMLGAEADGLFDVRQSILGHLQQGGNPSPFDRILASRLGAAAVGHLIAEAGVPARRSVALGIQGDGLVHTDLDDLPRLMDTGNERPRQQWWMDLRPMARMLAKPAPDARVRAGRGSSAQDA